MEKLILCAIMSLFNSADSCGPSTSVQKLSSFSNTGNVVNNDYNPNLVKQQSSSFKTSGMSSKLEQDFKNFEGSSDYRVGGMPVSRFSPLPEMLRLQNQQHQPVRGEHKWLNDFSNLQLNQHNNVSQTQLMNQMPMEQARAMNQISAGQTQAMNHRMAYVPQYKQGVNPVMQVPNSRNQSEHQQVHKYQTEDDIFEAAFNNIEKEVGQTVETGLEQDAEGNELSAIAGRIKATMESQQDTEELNSKFKNSNFLKLMNKISDKKVVIAEDGKDLVDNTGNNISSPDKSRLGDPLDYVRGKEEFDSPEDFRKLVNLRINGDHILPRTVDEIHMDYGHNDNWDQR